MSLSCDITYDTKSEILCDPIGYDGDFADRNYTQCVCAGRTWEGGFSIEV